MLWQQSATILLGSRQPTLAAYDPVRSSAMISSTAQSAFRIRQTRTAEADKLPEIEKSAAKAFESIPALNWIAAEPPCQRKCIVDPFEQEHAG